MKSFTGGTVALMTVMLLTAAATTADPTRNRGSVSPAARIVAMTTSTATEVSDASVTALVKSKLATNANTRDLHVDVDTKNGVVRLSGEVWSAEERDLVELLARNTEAVAMVQNDLIVLGRGIASR